MASTEYTSQHIDTYFLDNMSGDFEKKSVKLMDNLNAARKKLTKDPSNPSVLAEYQSALLTYTLLRNAQTSTIKAYKDIGAAIIQNFR